MPVHTFKNTLRKSGWSEKPVDVFVVGKDIFTRAAANDETMEQKNKQNLSLAEINAQSEGIEFLPAVLSTDLLFDNYQRDAANDAQYGKKDSA